MRTYNVVICLALIQLEIVQIHQRQHHHHLLSLINKTKFVHHVKMLADKAKNNDKSI